MDTQQERIARFNSMPMGVLSDQTTTWLQAPPDGWSWRDAVQLVRDADRADGERKDMGLASLNAYVVGPAGDGTMALAHRDGALAPVPLRDTAFKHLCARIGAPADYVKRLPGRLQVQLLDHGMRASDATGNLLRLAGGEARALLSDRYAALDNALVIEAMDDALAHHGITRDVRVVGLATGVTTALRLSLPTEGAIMPSGLDADWVQLGLDITNGEVGNRAVSVIGTVYRLVCKNGLRAAHASDAHRLRHVGDPARLREAFQQAVPAAISSARGTRQRLERSIDRLATDVLSEIDGLRQFGLGLTDTREVARDVAASRGRALPEVSSTWQAADFGSEPVRVWDVVNAMTHVAQSRAVDARLDMEEAAGRYLERRTR